MPTGNYDSSYITQRRNAMALYAFNNANQLAVNNGAVRREQPTLQSGAVIVERRQGGCFCSDINNGNVYTDNGPGGCGCGGGAK